MVAVPAKAQTSGTLISLTNKVWSYNDAGTNQGVAWRDAVYPAEAQWPTGRGLFGVETSLPYPYPAPIRTPLALGGGRITYYFRTHFNFVGNPANVSLIATSYVDDGAVFYLNGSEARRVRLPSTPITFTTVADLANPEGVPVVFIVPNSQLKPGDNVFAVELHQNSGSGNDAVFGLSLNVVAAQAPVLTNPAEPADRILPQDGSTTLQIYATGFPSVVYQWFKNGAAIPGATSSSYAISAAIASDGGNYFARATNEAGSVTSRTAVVTYLADTVLPRILYAVALPDPTMVQVVFSEPVGSIEATDTFNWELLSLNGTSPGSNPINGTLSDGTNLVLTFFEVRDPALAYKLKTGGEILDLHGNVLAPGTEIPVGVFEVVLLPMDGTDTWRYNQDGVDLGTSWREPAYNDAAWRIGAAPFDALFEFPGRLPCREFISGTGDPVRTCISLSNLMNTAQIPTSYFRTHFRFDGNPADAVLRLDSLVNDGAAIYLNGAEILRFNLPDGPVLYTTRAPEIAGSAIDHRTEVFLHNLVPGDNLLAAEVHQYLEDNADITFGLRLSALLRTLPRPRLTIQVNAGQADIRWMPTGGTLESTDDLNGTWVPVMDVLTAGHHVVPASSLKNFYRVTVP
jgi:hypothetical protein